MRGVLREFKLTAQAEVGLYVSLQGALQLVEYLSRDVGYKYLMTRRINQDALEVSSHPYLPRYYSEGFNYKNNISYHFQHFFGLIRQSCGPNQHPDPIIFIQLYRLLSTYALISPPRGSNVSETWGGGGVALKTLLSLQDVVAEEDLRRKVDLEKKLDAIIDFAGDFDFLESYFDTKIREDIDPAALKYFAGYVVRKAKKSTVAKTCDKCFEALLAPPGQVDRDNDLIEFRSHGFLFTPSDDLMNIIYRLEMAILTVLDSNKLSENILFEGNILTTASAAL